MRVGQFTTDDAEGPEDAWAGVVNDDTVVSLHEAGASAGVTLPETTREILAEWNWREKVELAVSYAEETGVGTYSVDSLERVAPVTRPQKVVAVGLNYSEHADEGEFDTPDEPVLFAKFPQSLVGPDATVEWDPELTDAVDYEGELVAVIGEKARNVSEADARDYVAGYTVGNDVSARDLQNRDEQWVRGKSLDTFGPLGPDLVTPDELDDVHDLDIWTEVNGERLQESNTEHLIFDIDEIIAFCSRAFTLYPGDVIYTGTPDGVGFFRDPQVLLGDGDTVTVGVEGVGELTNDCAER
ncbi:5-carboxymethyl-2-hydroxymuconate isomerase [Haloprofundus marisrubri]|uniref:5-carboxymethyl-2-hydroxymuconate isomerase n=1 Tax=Haloprofundus marisrubri TaxID=1514971 RepID=A0A0W1RDJ4_9EURY|nr:fumarylacetoacetate hydrolase family protein [Haloprofundus marisrubri]KTG11511.1 5-carboxymethyl-2-hydroxymuconate isomerase [Haloprofundus marisrubri]